MNASVIPGWMTDAELAWLADRAKDARRIVEIGSWKGRSTVALASNTPGTVWAVDTWAGVRGDPATNAEFYHDAANAYDEFRANVKGLPVTPFRGESIEAASHFFGQRKYFDMIFIDADHRYEGVKADIAAWRPLLRPGGLLCGHDYNLPAVKRAVDEMIPNAVIGPDTIWSVKRMTKTRTIDPWTSQEGRDLDPLPIEPGNWQRVVACLNIWNDLAELRANIDSWYPHVDHVIAVDGAYAGMQADCAESTDGTLEYLRTLEKVEIVEAAGFWPDQCVKRSEYFRRARPGDLLFVVDADETIQGAETLRTLPRLDVGWLRVTAPLYKREQGQPRVFAYRPGLAYDRRHHWIHDSNGLICTHQRGGPGLLHRLVPLHMHNSRGARRESSRLMLGKSQRRIQVSLEQEAAPVRTAGHEPLRVLQMAPIDPGIVVARMHSAINTTTPHSSVMAIGAKEWTAAPRQYDTMASRATLKLALGTTDIVHLHVNYNPLKLLMKRPSSQRGRLVIHHHGTAFRRGAAFFNRVDTDALALRLVSNLEMLQYGENLHWLPNPVPFARYRALGELLRPAWKRGTLRIAHSPSKRANKATEVFLRVCERLNSKGLHIEPLLIERLPWSEALVLKASAHASFDSFWLGMQCSGIEAAAMGQPVIAGDEDCRREYSARFGAVPYAYANTEAALESEIERLATEPAYYDLVAYQVARFVEENHDYAQVAAAYLELVDEAFHWRDKLTLGRSLARL